MTHLNNFLHVLSLQSRRFCIPLEKELHATYLYSKCSNSGPIHHRYLPDAGTVMPQIPGAQNESTHWYPFSRRGSLLSPYGFDVLQLQSAHHLNSIAPTTTFSTQIFKAGKTPLIGQPCLAERVQLDGAKMMCDVTCPVRRSASTEKPLTNFFQAHQTFH